MFLKITEGFMEMPEHHKVVLKAFGEKALDGAKNVNQLSEDYNADKTTTVYLWEKLQHRYGRTVSDEILA